MHNTRQRNSTLTFAAGAIVAGTASACGNDDSTTTSLKERASYNIDGQGAYLEPNTGVYALTQNPRDMGRFRVATLRNIAVTAPLSEGLDHYAAAGRSIVDGPDAGDESNNPLKSPFLIGFELSLAEREDLLAFFECLTDTNFLTDPRFSNPWLE